MACKGVGAAAVITNRAGAVLLVHHSYGRCNWELPGGAAEAHESLVETVLREVQEETGLAVVAEATTGIYYDAADDVLHFVFRCAVRDPAAEPEPDGHEITACGYWAAEGLPRPISDFTVQRIQDALGGRRMPLPTLIGPRRWLDEGAEQP
jgi:8-oxo-dGTP pyrophosphatase MutT (NUDIX family)